MSLEQARAELAAATDAHEAALEALRAAKVRFFDSAADKDRRVVVVAEDGVRSAALLLERAEHFFSEAQRVTAEQSLADQRRRLEDLKAATVARTARVSQVLMALVDIERAAFELVNEIERLSIEQGAAFNEGKSLALAVGEPTPIQRPKNAADFRYELGALIRATQIREHRDGYSNGQVSTWLQPAAFATSIRTARESA